MTEDRTMPMSEAPRKLPPETQREPKQQPQPQLLRAPQKLKQPSEGHPLMLPLEASRDVALGAASGGGRGAPVGAEGSAANAAACA